MPPSNAPSLTLPFLPEIRDRLLSDPTAWPDATGIDTAGLQLVLSALKTGGVPKAVLRHPDVVARADALGVVLPGEVPA